MKSKTNKGSERSEHTPGPWNVATRKTNEGYNRIYSPVIEGKSATVALIESDRDANLIAAAPELLEAAKLAMSVWPEHMRGSLLEAAIAKAEGRY